MPGGITQSFPYQLYISRGDGCHVWDADGRKLVDLVYGDWLYPLGHNHPAVTAAIAAQLAKGPTFCIPDPDLGYEAASRLLARFPWLDMIRYTASGTEATLMATRLARAYTHRPKIAKIAGGYHGVHDASMIVNMRTRDPFVTPQGLIPGTEDSVVLLPYNDTETSLKTIETHADELALHHHRAYDGRQRHDPGQPGVPGGAAGHHPAPRHRLHHGRGCHLPLRPGRHPGRVRHRVRHHHLRKGHRRRDPAGRLRRDRTDHEPHG